MVKYYKRFRLVLVLAVIAMLISSCSDDVSAPRFSDSTYSLTGLLMAGSPIDLANPIYISKSSSIDDFEFEELFVADANIIIKEYTGNDVTATLVLTPVLDFGQDDQLQIPKIKYIDESGHIIQAQKRYRIEATIPGYDKLIWAETVVPNEVSLDTDFNNLNLPNEGYSTDPDLITLIPYQTLDDRYPIAVNTGSYSGSLNLFVEVFCMEEFSTDLEFTIPIFGITYADSSIAWIYNSNGDSMRRITFFSKFLTSYESEQQANYVVVRNFKESIAFYGRYRITALSIDDNFYRYRYMNEGYLKGGVHNALGYFGSASGGKLYTKVVKELP